MVQVDNGSIVKVSVTSDNVDLNEESYTPQISGDGNYVVFASDTDSLSGQNQNSNSNIFVYELETGTLEKISRAVDGSNTIQDSYSPSISNNGNYVAFASDANNLVVDDSNDQRDIFLYDRANDEIKLISQAADGSAANGFSSDPFISGSGNHVVFVSEASNLVADDTNEEVDVFVYDLNTDSIERVNLAFDGTEANEYSLNATISDDGSYVAYASLADNLVGNDNNDATDIFLYNRDLDTVERINVNIDDEEANGDSFNGVINSSGSYVVYTSEASNLVADDNNGVNDVFLYDLATDVTERVSIGNQGQEANDQSTVFPASISSDGRLVTFFSAADNLVEDDTNSQGDVFVRDRLLNTTQRVSVSANSEQPNDFSTIASISNDGSKVAFYSSATNIISEDDDGADIFVRTLEIADPSIANLPPTNVQFELGQDVYASGSVLQIVDGTVIDPNGVGDLAGVNFWLYDVANERWNDLGNATDLAPVAEDSNSATFNYNVILSDLESGEYDLWARGYDQLGELSEQEVIRSFTIDNTIADGDNVAPSDLEFELTPNNIVQGETITVLGSIFDPDAASDVALIDFWLYDQTLETWTDIADESTFVIVPEANIATFEYNLTVPELTSGTYSLWGRGYDFSGESSDTEVIRDFTVTEEINNADSTEIPNSLEFTLDQTTYSPDATINVQGSIADPDGGSDVALIDFWLYDAALDSWTDIDNSATSFGVSDIDSNTALFEYEFTIPDLEPGEYGLWARGFDFLSFSSNEYFADFEVEETVSAASNLPPTDLEFSLDQTAYSVGDALTGQGSMIDFDGSDDVSSVDFWVYNLDSDSWTDLPDVTEFNSVAEDINAVIFEYSADLAGLDAGSYTLWGRGYDVAGNVSDNEIYENFSIFDSADAISLPIVEPDII